MVDSQVLKRLDFPAYCIKVLDNGLVAIAGGGGTSKTGVGNSIEIGLVDYELLSNQKLADNKVNLKNGINNGQAVFKSIHTFEPEDAIMKFISFTCERQNVSNSNKKNGITNNPNEFDGTKNDIYLAAAVNDIIEVYKLIPKVDKGNGTTQINHQENNHNVKNRKNSSKSRTFSGSSAQNKNGTTGFEATATLAIAGKINIKALCTNTISENDETFESETPTIAKHSHEQVAGGAQMPRTRKRTASLRSDEESVTSLAVCKMKSLAKNKSSGVLLISGTSKGSIIVWSLIFDGSNERFLFEKVHEFKEAHGKHEIDDLQVNSLFKKQDGAKNGKINESTPNELHQLISIGRDNKCFVWSLSTFKKISEVNYLPTLNNDTNLRMKHIRFSSIAKTFYATFIPRIRGGGRDMSSYVERWSFELSQDGNTFYHKLESKLRLRNTIITTIQCSKDGNHVCMGDADGKINLYDLNFSKVINFKKQHSSVITDLAFYHDYVANVNNKYNDNNKLILSISIDRTLQCYKFINNSSIRYNKFDFCSLNAFKFIFILSLFVVLFCYFFTYVE